ncbi:MAG: type IV pilin N-terminal domain-containing protein [Methanoculleus sp.]|jgi:flagellin-like protein
MMKFKKNEEAVSPVIGVILMVAITVILAAVIAAFVFGMGSNVQGQKNVAIGLQKNGTFLEVTIEGGSDVGNLQYLKVIVDDKAWYSTTDLSSPWFDWTTPPLDRTGGFKVGDVFTNSPHNPLMNPARYNHVVVVGHFKDNHEQILADKQL